MHGFCVFASVWHNFAKHSLWFSRDFDIAQQLIPLGNLTRLSVLSSLLPSFWSALILHGNFCVMYSVAWEWPLLWCDMMRCWLCTRVALTTHTMVVLCHSVSICFLKKKKNPSLLMSISLFFSSIANCNCNGSCTKKKKKALRAQILYGKWCCRQHV